MTVPTGKPRGRPPKHGAYSGTALIPLTQEKTELIRGLLEGTVHMIGPTDMPYVELLARSLAKVELIDRWLQTHGLFSDEAGNPWPILKTVYFSAMNSAARMCDALGLNPQSRLRLGIGVAQVEDLGQRMAESARRIEEENAGDPGQSPI